MTELRIAAAILFALAISAPARAETVKVGIIRTAGYPAVPIAMARGYFKDEGIDVDLVVFDSAQPVAVGVASGAVAFGTAGLSASLMTLAGHGELRFIAAASGEHKGFHTLEFLASNKAWDEGLRSPKDLAGHAVAITQLGTTLHYAIGCAAEKFGYPLSAVTVRPLQSNSNVIAALSGSTVDAAVLPGATGQPLLDKGGAHVIGWTSDVLPDFSSGAMLFTRADIADAKGDLVRRFLAAYRRGTRDYHDAFISPDGKPATGPDTQAVLKIMSDFTGVAPESLIGVMPYADRDARISTSDLAHQLVWYKAQNLVKGDVTATAMIDKRYVLPLPPPTGSDR